MTEWKSTSRLLGATRHRCAVKKIIRTMQHRKARRVTRQLVAKGREEQILDRPLNVDLLY